MDIKDDIEKCHFIPISVMRKVIENLESSSQRHKFTNCKHNLARLQINQNKKKSAQSSCEAEDWLKVFQIACNKAIYSHDWNKLAYLLQKCPPWQLNITDFVIGTHYIRILTILLMYHPSSQAQGLLNDYLHMVWSCRTDEDKKAILKTLLTLPEKIYGTYRHETVVDSD